MICSFQKPEKNLWKNPFGRIKPGTETRRHESSQKIQWDSSDLIFGMFNRLWCTILPSTIQLFVNLTYSNLCESPMWTWDSWIPHLPIYPSNVQNRLSSGLFSFGFESSKNGTCHHPYSKKTTDFSLPLMFVRWFTVNATGCQFLLAMANVPLGKVVSYHINHTRKILEFYGFTFHSGFQTQLYPPASFYRVDVWHKPPAPPEVRKHYAEALLVSRMACLWVTNVMCDGKNGMRAERLFWSCEKIHFGMHTWRW